MKNAALLFLTVIISTITLAQPKERVGANDFTDWSGASKVKNGEALIANGTAISYTYADQNRIYFPGISRPFHGDAADWTKYSGLVFDVYLHKETTAQISAVLKVDTLDYEDLNPVSTAQVRLVGKGWHTVYIPWDLFDIDAGQRQGTFFAVKHVLLSLQSDENPTYKIRNVFVTKGLTAALEAEIRGKSSDPGTEVQYEMEVANTTDELQGIQMVIETMGWESMKARIEPSVFSLSPGEVGKCVLTVEIPAHLPQGIREKQVVKAIANGSGASSPSLEFTTAVHVPFPNIIFTDAGWQKINEKIEKYDWAKEALEEYERNAKKWVVPNGADFSNETERPLGKSVFSTNGTEIYDCAIAYHLTGNEAYAEKCLKLLRRLIDPKTGYQATLVGGSNSFVGEGKFWQAVGRMYDLVRNSPQVTAEDRQRTEATFRLFVTQTLKGNSKGAISNWNVAELTAAMYCALNLQDWYLIDQLLNAPTGIYKHLEHGIMNDGWWYECAVGYNTWVATEFSEIALALEPWGINFKDMTFPIGTTKHFSLLASRRQGGIMGMEFEKWGKIERNSVSIKDMWDASIPFMDFRGVLLAVNDAVEGKLSGKSYELAYYIYRDPEYAAIINRGDTRDLLYGVPDLPKVTSEKMKVSAYADNMGIVQLRSQTAGRQQSEQIQAALHYGSHGGYHGHFDRTDLVHMSRYGRSFYGTLMFWYGYQSYLYKFWKQVSINKNMVVVDQKMQQPVENKRLLFHTGDMMQATAIETNSKWSHPPYGGIPNDRQTFAEKMWDESRTIDLPAIQPAFGEVTEFTEPVLQRRAMVVMDDYIVLADYLNGENEHEFDWMFQSKGFKGIKADKVELVKHTNQMNTDPIGSAQFITDCNWYEVEGTSRTQFEMCWGEGCDNEGVRLPYSLDGPLKIDVFNAWPPKSELMIGTSTEGFYVNKKLWYTVSVDDQQILSDSTGAWILGSKTISLDISGKSKLELTTMTPGKIRNNTIFWGDAKLVLKNGSTVYLSSLPVKYENVLIPENKGKDYYGGPIKIAGEPMEKSLPAMPENNEELAKITVDLDGMDVLRFEAKIGGDFPLGDESSRLKSMAVRSKGTQARYLSVIEPYETKSMIKSVVAKNENELVVTLTDGRVQEIKIEQLDSQDGTIEVFVRELKNGKMIREEQTK
ncbi:alginate lyase family protein [Reichenbachiella agarivorans]|uniref:Alginate lyase family protein n=1 Tax=Reichenbachiella agarivorans TaxID=2979464 RepID=A0ABY6CQ15_9BACT|nr:alginate lyase family protein [Reichenbachiella agarivorans]UXP32611.1 alginate lyase family protein [Reichenbachiella agarivorans]